MVAQRKLQKDAADAQAAREVEDREVERKAAIKEKEQATSKKVEDQSEPVSEGALEGNQDQRKSGARTKSLQARAKDKDKDFVPDSNFASQHCSTRMT